MNDITDTIKDINIVEKKKCGRKKMYEGGCRQHEKDSKYHQNYYHMTNKPINCEICGKKSTLRSINLHHETIKCQIIKLHKQQLSEDELKSEMFRIITKNSKLFNK